MRSSLRAIAALFVAAAVVLAAPGRPALAHGRLEVGDYELVIGFKVEPAYQGEPNGLDLRVSNKATKEPVLDLSDTLKAEIIHGASKREVAIRPQFGKDGAYTADVLPSEAGDYTWHIWGEINGTPVDVSMTSGEGTFGAVDAKSEVAFPAAEATAAELKTAAETAQAAAQRATLIGGAGVVLGLLGTVAGVLGFRAARQRA